MILYIVMSPHFSSPGLNYVKWAEFNYNHFFKHIVASSSSHK